MTPDALPAVDLRFGDCLAVLRDFPDASVHAVICDPPYGLADIRPAQVTAALTAWANGDREHVPNGRGFMGRDWDSFVPPPAVWDECLRVLTPGGHLVAFAGSRTYDLMGLSIRMAGFEIRDGLQWLYGSSMPKGRDLGRDSVQWSGWNTSLKPAHEPIVLARKPLSGTVAATVLAHGTGALHVDACRVGDGSDRVSGGAGGMADRDYAAIGGGWHAGRIERPTGGRWPANVLLGHAAACGEGFYGDPAVCVPGCPVAELDEQSGTLKSGNRKAGEYGLMGYMGADAAPMPEVVGDSGGASRFFAQFRHTAADHGFFPIESVPCGDGSTTVASTSAGRSPANSDGSSLTDGPGGRPTDPFPTDTRSTTGTTTRSTTTSTTSCASPPSGTTTTTSGSASSTAGSTGSSSAGANGARSGNPSLTSTSDEPGPGRATADLASAPTVESGSHATGKRSTPDDATGTPAASPPDSSPTFRYQAKAPASERPKIDGKGWPTVKPQGVMRWLVRLLTPPGGVVLDPFGGTGSTGQAAQAEGFASILVERDEFAYRLACTRLGLPDPGEGFSAAPVDAPAPVVDITPAPEPEPVDPILAALEEAATAADLVAVWRAHKASWTEAHTVRAAELRAQLEGAA